MSFPSILHEPSVGRSNAPTMFIIVLLPEPDAPMMATYSPLLMVTSTDFKASTRTVPSGLKYVREMPWSSITGRRSFVWAAVVSFIQLFYAFQR